MLVAHAPLEARGTQRTLIADLGGEAESLQLSSPAILRRVPTVIGQGRGRVSGRAAAAHRLQVDLELVLGEKLAFGLLGPLSQQGDAALIEAFSILAAAVGAVAQGRLDLQAGVSAGLLDQLQ